MNCVPKSGIFMHSVFQVNNPNNLKAVLLPMWRVVNIHNQMQPAASDSFLTSGNQMLNLEMNADKKPVQVISHCETDLF